ncbi:hypothetical protein [Actinomadura parmotrematis]|uniref:Lipoprotein n=1 Tax=Actinomadura parmotrematis TaxID=2864039 RepID=A0ABS7FMY2_9ACTN|nr:hypothetical protein [Actinomadura parmotrematis]MBW8480942.1 hypothetical protein [Actinomadura parmotrematis]
MRTALAPLLLLAAALPLAACGGGGDPKKDARPSGATPFTGTWRSAAGGDVGNGGTVLTVDAAGALTFKTSLDCTGKVAKAAADYRFTFDCGTSKFDGTAPAPKSGAFTMTWTDGDTSEFRA